MASSPKLIRLNSEAQKVCPSGSNGRPRVAVLMSTYNGEKYLQEQVDSIAAQEGVEVEMFVRDDGSSDGTRKLLKEMSSMSKGCISSWNLTYGENLGFLESFERLLISASGCDWYAFSDQDDVWLPNKLLSAVDSLCLAKASLYASTVEIVDEKLETIGRNDFPGLTYTIAAELIRHRLAGHTMVWSDALQSDIHSMGKLPCWSHDQHVIIAALISGTDMVFDESPHVLHRRLTSSVTPGGAGLVKRLRHELDMLWNPGHRWNREALAIAVGNIHGADITNGDRAFLQKCAAHKKIGIISDPEFNCGLAAGNAEACLSVLLGRF
jgi:hypothetical protein